ncbi:hypothetical protein [Paenibacillus sp. YAF4_2]|uniref:hypothetical protein n=1 Tax=Paenibacillus sp. YAF4_2 TaxID=3233085 RepID=UPI003F94F0A5
MIVFVIIGVCLVGAFLFWVLHEVIQSAIDNSTLAKNVQDIRNHLIGKGTQQETAASGEDHEPCPGCKHMVRKTDRVCYVCGLALRDWD